MRDTEGRQHYEALGAADDIRDPDGLTVRVLRKRKSRPGPGSLPRPASLQATLSPNGGSSRSARRIAGLWLRQKGQNRAALSRFYVEPAWCYLRYSAYLLFTVRH